MKVKNNYQDSWSVSPSTKAGGYLKWIHTVDYPLCDECKQTMEHLFSIGSLGGIQLVKVLKIYK